VSVIWKTKFGGRRVRQEPPDIAEALAAAACMSEDLEQQIGLAAALLGVDPEEVRKVAARESRRPQRTLELSASRRTGRTQSVVVERKRSRRAIGA
jgi:tRNA A37 N6-isopentenylltransferase MiaA